MLTEYYLTASGAKTADKEVVMAYALATKSSLMVVPCLLVPCLVANGMKIVKSGGAKTSKQTKKTRWKRCCSPESKDKRMS